MYEIGDKTYEIKSGQYLIIPPLLKYRIYETQNETLKYSIAFTLEDNSLFFETVLTELFCTFGNTTNDIAKNLDLIENIKENHSQFCDVITANRVFEIIVSLFISFGLKEPYFGESSSSEDPRLLLAKKFIEDNIKLQLTVTDISSYCHLSNKQITRLFKQFEGSTPLAYIQKRRCDYIENLLLDDKYSIREISELMNFNNEFYFNSFF